MSTVMQLVRLDPAFRWAPLIAGVLFVFGLSLATVEVRTFVFAIVAPSILIAALTQANSGRRCETWQAALPIHGQALLVARLSACLFMTWVSWASWLAGLSMRGMGVGNAFGGTISTPLLITLVIAVMLVTRRSAMEPAVSLPVFWGFLSMAAMVVIGGGFFLGAPFLTCVALVAGGLLAYAIRRAPACFQVRVASMPRKSESAIRSVGFHSSRARNSPFLAAMKSWQFLWLCSFSLGEMLFVRGGASLFLVAMLPGAGPMFSRTDWMCSLPVSRARVLAWAILPWWLILVVSYRVGVSLRPLPELAKAIAGSNYWLADYLLTQFFLAAGIRCEFWSREAPSARWGRWWRITGTFVLFSVPLLLGSRSPFETAEGLPFHVPVALAIARYLPSEPILWAVLICGTPILLWMWLLRAFARVESPLNPAAASRVSVS